jgi:hypothetical protein
MSMCWNWVRGRPLGFAFVSVRAIAMSLFVAVVTTAPALALQTPTPEPAGYRGASQSEAYQGAFSDLVHNQTTSWGIAK